jgi:hypothetical protein
MVKKIQPHCGASRWFNEVIRTGFQFRNVDSVRILSNGRCDLLPFEGDPRPCTGFVRKEFEHPRSWGTIPRMTPPRSPQERQFVYYDADCAMGSAYTNYRVVPLSTALDASAPLTAAVHRLLRYWYRSEPRLLDRISYWVDISVINGTAIFDWQSLRHLGWASTTCGGAAFGSSLVRTASQFPTVDEVEFRYRGSCERFNAWQQGGPSCFRTTVDEYDQVVRIWSEA